MSFCKEQKEGAADMKKVLFLIHSLGHGGAEKVLVNLVNNMDKTKFNVTVQTLIDSGVNKKYLSPDVRYLPGVREFKGNSRIMSLISPKVLYKFYVREKYDIVIAYLEGTSSRVLSGCTDSNVKKAAWVHIEFDNEKKYARFFKGKKEITDFYSSMNKVVCVSDSVRMSLEKCADRRFPNAAVLYNTVESDRILRLAGEPIEDVRFDEGEVKICSVGKITGTKGFDRLARIQKRLLAEGLRSHIYILGVGEDQEKIMNYLRKNDLLETYTFLGYRDNPYKYVAACDLYVCASHREGFSTAVTEALIVGTPVVSTCCSGAYELLGKNNEYGIVTENSEEGIYRGIKEITDSYERLLDYKKKAQQRGKLFSKEKTTKAVEDMLLNL